MEEAVRSAILNVTFDCKDAAFLARFWSGVTTLCAVVDGVGCAFTR
jgi:hypothetical protein